MIKKDKVGRRKKITERKSELIEKWIKPYKWGKVDENSGVVKAMASKYDLGVVTVAGLFNEHASKSTEKFAVGGEVGNQVNFRGDYGKKRIGIITGKKNGGYTVATDDGNVFVESYEIDSFEDAPVAKKKRFGFFEGGGSVDKYKLFEGYDHYKGVPIYQVVAIDEDDEYEGEWHKDKKDAEKELEEMNSKKYEGGGEIQAKIDKLQFVVNSKMLPESAKKQARETIAKLEKELDNKSNDDLLIYFESGDGESFIYSITDLKGKEFFQTYSSSLVSKEWYDKKDKLESKFSKEIFEHDHDDKKYYGVIVVKGNNSEVYKTGTDEWENIKNKLHESKETKAEEKAEHNFKIGSKIGFLRPNTGRYEYADVISIDGENVNLVVRHPKRSQLDNYFTETKSKISKGLDTSSEDWKDGRALIIIKKETKAEERGEHSEKIKMYISEFPKGLTKDVDGFITEYNLSEDEVLKMLMGLKQGQLHVLNSGRAFTTFSNLEGDKKKAVKEILDFVKSDKAFKYKKPSYKLGDQWAMDFDYRGLLEYSLKVDKNTSIKDLEKLHSSFEDNNYHTLGAPLWDAISDFKQGKEERGEMFLLKFKKGIKDELEDEFEWKEEAPIKKEEFVKTKHKGEKEISFVKSEKVTEIHNGKESENFFKVGEAIYGTILKENSKQYLVKSSNFDGVEYIVGKDSVKLIPIKKESKPTAKKEIVGYAIVDPISGGIVASKKTLSELIKSFKELDSRKEFEDVESTVFEIVKKGNKNVIGDKISEDKIKIEKEVSQPKRLLDKLKENGKLKRYYLPVGANKKTFETIIPSKILDDVWDIYRSPSRSSLGIAVRNNLTEEDLIEYFGKKVNEPKFKIGEIVLVNHGEERGVAGKIIKAYSDDIPYYEIEGASKEIPESNLELFFHETKKPKPSHKKLVAKLKAKKGEGNNNRASLIPFTETRRKRNESSDRKREALPLGKRVSKDGNVYWENRLNRGDISKEDKFEGGGGIGAKKTAIKTTSLKHYKELLAKGYKAELVTKEDINKKFEGGGEILGKIYESEVENLPMAIEYKQKEIRKSYPEQSTYIEYKNDSKGKYAIVKTKGKPQFKEGGEIGKNTSGWGLKFLNW